MTYDDATAQLAAVEPVRPDIDDPKELRLQDYTQIMKDPTRAAAWFQYFASMEEYKKEVRQYADICSQHVSSLLKEGQDLEKRLTTVAEQAENLRSLLDQESGRAAALEAMFQKERAMANQFPKDYEYARKTTKLPDAPKFNGAREDVENFIFQLRRKLSGNLDHYPDAQQQLYYAIGLLEGPALAQVVARTTDGQVDFDDIDALYVFLRKAFGDPDRKATAKRELSNLRQAYKEFAVFYAEFSRLASESGFNEDALSFQLGQAISMELRELMLHHEVPDSYQKYVELLQSLDSRMRANQAINKKASRPFFKTSYPSSGSVSSATTSRSASPMPSLSSVGSYRAPSTILGPSDSASSLGTTPMDLSAARAPTSVEEKNRRRAIGLCLYCGLSGHSAEQCPRLKCYNCQDQGHVARHCTKPRRQRIYEVAVQEEEGSQGKD